MSVAPTELQHKHGPETRFFVRTDFTYDPTVVTGNSIVSEERRLGDRAEDARTLAYDLH